MVKNAVVFSGRNGLDFGELRSGVIRIPEVSLRLREAQKIMDRLDVSSIDLMTVICSDDETFVRNLKLKSLLAAVVQVGLFDRLMTSHRRPDFLIGNCNGDSAMLVCAGRISFADLIESSQALSSLRPAEKVVSLVPSPEPVLSGILLTEYQAMEFGLNEFGQPGYEPVLDGVMDLKKIIASLFHERGAVRFISIGPAAMLRGVDYQNLCSDEVESMDSIELDPMLSWFWRAMRSHPVAVSQ